MKKIFAILLLAFSCVLFWYCQKRLFTKIHFKGTVVDWYTNQPIETTINVSAYKKLGFGTLREELIECGSFNSNSDGSFDHALKSAKSDHYYISFTELHAHPLLQSSGSFHKDQKTNNKANLDFGTLYDMPHVFICKIALTYTSTSTNHIVFNSNNDFPPGTNTIVYVAQSYSQKQYETNSHNYTLNYTLTNNSYPYQVYKQVIIPIINDSATTTISF